MSISNKFVFIVLTIVAWIIFVALCIEAGGLLVNFVFSLFKPEVVHNLYQKLDLSQLYARSPWAYFSMYSYILVIAGLKVFLFYVVVMLVTRLDLAKPFSAYVSLQITRISYCTLAIGLLSYLARQTTRELQKRGFETDVLNQFWVDSQAFIFMAAVVYIIAAIFRKGVELQNENDLTV
ncbi:MAG: DUF2975 domain-containing protein [Bacteroidales bacterium]|nr:DUF2975 domain-containing protein [Bacteroidales bacterium]